MTETKLGKHAESEKSKHREWTIYTVVKRNALQLWKRCLKHTWWRLHPHHGGGVARQKGSIQEHPFHPASLNGRFRNVLFMFYTLVLSFIFAFEIWGSAHHFADHFLITLRSHPPLTLKKLKKILCWDLYVLNWEAFLKLLKRCITKYSCCNANLEKPSWNQQSIIIGLKEKRNKCSSCSTDVQHNA